MTKSIQVEIIPQLKDNYSYLVYSNVKKLAVVIDPADATPIIEYIKDKNIVLSGILVTHHHADHTSGIKELLSFKNVVVYSPNLAIPGTSKLIKDRDNIVFDFIDFKVLASPGHTLDHIIFYNATNKLLFSGDTLFRFGCGRVFEGTYNEMKKSLNKVYSPTPYGFNRVGDDLVKNKKEKRLLNKMFRLKDSGLSYGKICDYLKRNRHKTKNGKKWTPSNVYSVMKSHLNTPIITPVFG